MGAAFNVFPEQHHLARCDLAQILLQYGNDTLIGRKICGAQRANFSSINTSTNFASPDSPTYFDARFALAQPLSYSALSQYFSGSINLLYNYTRLMGRWAVLQYPVPICQFPLQLYFTAAHTTELMPLLLYSSTKP